MTASKDTRAVRHTRTW